MFPKPAVNSVFERLYKIFLSFVETIMINLFTAVYSRLQVFLSM